MSDHSSLLITLDDNGVLFTGFLAPFGLERLRVEKEVASLHEA